MHLSSTTNLSAYCVPGSVLCPVFFDRILLGSEAALPWAALHLGGDLQKRAFSSDVCQKNGPHQYTDSNNSVMGPPGVG